MFQPEEYDYLLHEIKNYICVINGSLHLITKQHPEVHEYRYWDEVLSDVSHLSQMCREISASNLHAKIQLQSVNPTDFFRSLKNEVIGILGTNVHFSLELSPNLPEINMDPIQIKHALINLIKNAYEAIFNTGNIILSVSAKYGHLYIKIQDNGCGMSADQLDKIFLPAYTTKIAGTGIGLFITRTIIDAHGGSISCKSQYGEGTTFTLSLPLRETE